jgi:hypothetical protein
MKGPSLGKVAPVSRASYGESTVHRTVRAYYSHSVMRACQLELEVGNSSPRWVSSLPANDFVTVSRAV